MALKTYKPTSDGRRSLVSVDRSELWKGGPVKKLTEGLSSKGGRNNQGRLSRWLITKMASRSISWLRNV
jgi:large subunit ribosomal protein L2